VTAAAPQPGSHAALRERLRQLRLSLALLVLLGLAALLAASRSAPREAGSSTALLGHVAGWLAAQLAVIAAILLGLRWLRRRRFGALPSTRLRRPSDVLLHVGAGLGGALALLGFLPALAAGRAAGLDWAIASTGLVLLAVGLRAAALHVTRA
jgi:type IV secretory pathway VirB2 component (pilin)